MGILRAAHISRLIAALAVAAALTPPVDAKQAPDFDARLVSFGRTLELLRRLYDIPGLAAAIVLDRRVVWEGGFGYADVAARVPVTPLTLFPVASLTKTMTSVLLLQCVERGTLDLDTPIRTYSSAIPEANASVRHVLSHTSEGTPGVRFRYNGDRFAALTPVVEACTGQPYRVAVTERILTPLAMQDSVPGHDLQQPTASLASMFEGPALVRFGAALTRLAKPYANDRGRVRLTDYPPSGINASAGVISTVRDLAGYDAALDQGFLLGRDARALAWSRYVSPSAGPQPYGLGWFVQPANGVTLIWHYGQWPQFSALYLKVPERNITLLLLANSSDVSSRFQLAGGDVTTSSFARLFLRLFVE